MPNKYWLIPAIACLVAWGISRFFPKLATQHIDPKSAFVYEVSGELIIALFMLASLGFKPSFHSKGTPLALLAGVFGGLGVYWYLVAAQRGGVSQLVSLTALYPIITVMLGVFLLNDPITAKQMLGIVLAIIAVILVAT